MKSRVGVDEVIGTWVALNGELDLLKDEHSRLRKALTVIIGMAGTPDAAEGCRSIIKEALAALEGK